MKNKKNTSEKLQPSCDRIKAVFLRKNRVKNEPIRPDL